MFEQKAINQEPERVFKIVLAGDAAVGKSSFIMRLCKNKFVTNLNSTLGKCFYLVSFASVFLGINNNWI